MGQALNLPAAGVQAAGVPCPIEDEKPAILGTKRKIPEFFETDLF